VPATRWGARMGDAQMLDYMLQILHDPFFKIHMCRTTKSPRGGAAQASTRP